MKKFFSFLLSLAFAGSTFAQMSGYSSSNYSDGTTLGANETLTADGIALGNAVKLRGYVDFILGYDDEKDSDQNEEFFTTADVDLLLDFSPVTAEIHLAAESESDGEDVSLEQVFGRYSINEDLHITFGRQLTVLGYEADEAPGLFAVTTAQVLGDDSDISLLGDTKTRRNYVDGVRVNYNNGMFGLTVGLHDGYWVSDHFDGDDMAIDLAASVMFFPGLEARIGYAHESLNADSITESNPIPGLPDLVSSKDGDIDQINMWLSWNPGALTLATEFDDYGIDRGSFGKIDYWSWMLLGNYQFTDWFAGTLRYTHEDIESGSSAYDSDRLTFAVLFSLTDNFGLNVEYSTTSVDTPSGTTSPGDYNEFYIEGLITY
jgi:hypothetical protein